MKNLFLFACLLFSVSLFAQDAAEEASDRMLLETIILTPDLEKLPQLMENLAAHNKKYHPAGTPYQATVFNITTGPNTGKIVWMMGPHNWSDLDSRPAADGHDEDWVNNVVALLDDVSHAEYWKVQPKLSKNSGETYPMYYVRYHNFSKTDGYRAWDEIKKIAGTMAEMDEVKHWMVYDNMMRQGNAGRHLAMVSGMSSWAEMDDDWPFADTFEELYSRGERMNMAREMMEATTDSWDEIWTVNLKASGREE